MTNLKLNTIIKCEVYNIKCIKYSKTQSIKTLLEVLEYVNKSSDSKITASFKKCVNILFIS